MQNINRKLRVQDLSFTQRTPVIRVYLCLGHIDGEQIRP